MSQTPTQADSEADDEDEMANQYHNISEMAAPRELAIVDEGDHDLADKLGASDHRKKEANVATIGERFADRYSHVDAMIREYLANAETACVRAARYLLWTETDRSESDVRNLTVQESLSTAFDEIGYDPVITVTYSHEGSPLPRLTISDNGIGISADEFNALRELGASGTHQFGDTLGQFGQGMESGFLISGTYGEWEFVTYSRRDERNYRMRAEISGYQDLPGRRSGYGTSFIFPSFSQRATDELDVTAAVEKFSAGLSVPVMYEEYDAEGSEVFNEEYLPNPLEEKDAYDDDFVVVYEDSDVKLVTSPSCTYGNMETRLISMEIDRGNKASYECPWKFDVQIKNEDGRIWSCECDDVDHTGLVPLSDQKYDYYDEKGRDLSGYVRQSETSEDISLPKPVDDRDRLKGDNEAFLIECSRRLNEEWLSMVAVLFEELRDDGFEAFFEFDDETRELFLTAYKKVGPNFSDPTTDRIVSDVEDAVGVTLPDEVAAKLAHFRTDVSHAARGCSHPEKAGYRSDVGVWEVLSMAKGDDVYVAKTVSKNKSKLAWALGDNTQVVCVDEYPVWEDVFGWKKLKDLNTRSADEEYPHLSSDVLDDVMPDSVRGSGSGGNGGTSRRSSRDPTTKRIKVRTGTGSGQFTNVRAGDVADALSDEKTINVAYSNPVDHLLVKRETDGATASTYETNTHSSLGYTIVPDYVADYLLDLDRCFETLEAVSEFHSSFELPTLDVSGLDIDECHDGTATAGSDWADTEIGEMGSDTLILVVGADSTDQFVSESSEFVPVIWRMLDDDDTNSIDPSDYSRLVITDESIETMWAAFDKEFDAVDGDDLPDLATTQTTSLPYYVQRKTPFNVEDGDIVLEFKLPKEQFPRNSPEWNLMMNGAEYAVSNNTERAQHLVDTLNQLKEDSNGHQAFVSQQSD